MSTKLEVPKTNVPRCGTISAVWFAPTKNEKWDDQIKIVGKWETEGDGHFYQSIKTLEAYTDAGVVRQDPGTDKDGHPKFAVVNQNQRVMIVRKEVSGSNAKMTEVTPIDVQGNVVVLPACPKPVLVPQVSAAPSATAPPAPSAQAAPQAAPENGRERTRERWAELDEQYAACLSIAAYRLQKTLGDDVSDTAIQAGAATVMIQAERRGLPAYPGLAKGLFGRLNEHEASAKDETPQPVTTSPGDSPLNEPGDFPEALDDDDDGSDLPF